MNNESKTARQLIEESALPDEVKQAALTLIYGADFNKNAYSLSESILFASWASGQRESGQYWPGLYHYLLDGGDPANAPLPPLRLPEIPWEFVPEYYKYHAFDADGYGFFYSSLPYSADTAFTYDEAEVWQSSGLFLKTDRWRETLQTRDNHKKK